TSFLCSSRRRHTRFSRDWSSDVCSSDLALAEVAHDAGCPLVVDNVFCTPALQRPFEHGADLVIHSATKYLDGQGRCLGGAVVGRSEERRVGRECGNWGSEVCWRSERPGW